MNGLTSDVGSKELLQVLCLDGGHALLDLVVILLSWTASFFLAILLLAMAIFLRLSSQIVFVLLLQIIPFLTKFVLEFLSLGVKWSHKITGAQVHLLDTFWALLVKLQRVFLVPHIVERFKPIGRTSAI